MEQAMLNDLAFQHYWVSKELLHGLPFSSAYEILLMGPMLSFSF